MEGQDVIGRRIGAGFIDLAVVILLVLLVGGIVGNDVASDAPTSARFGALDRVLILALVFAYYWGTETIWAQTLGKRVLDIRVERVDGTKLTAGATFIRTLLRVVDGFGVYLVGLIVIFATGERRQRLGDLAAKTRVVSASAPPAGPEKPPPPPSDEDVIASVLR
jgi:uncharacterized RDD family membrane protein YckC